jgi:hypothetical protein
LAGLGILALEEPAEEALPWICQALEASASP